MRKYRHKQNVLQFRLAEEAPDEDGVSELEEKLFGQKISELERRLSYSDRLSRALSVIQTDFENPGLNLARASQICGVEKSHLNALLHRSSGATFHQLLVRYRVLKGARLLREKNRTVLETAISCGFGSVRTFNRNFQRFLGCGPCRFRKRLQWRRKEELRIGAKWPNPDS